MQHADAAVEVRQFVPPNRGKARVFECRFDGVAPHFGQLYGIQVAQAPTEVQLARASSVIIMLHRILANKSAINCHVIMYDENFPGMSLNVYIISNSMTLTLYITYSVWREIHTSSN